MEVVLTCPLGSDCEKAVGQVIHRCRWYITLEGQDPQSGDKINDSRCAMEYIPVLQIESSGVMTGVRDIMQKTRSETMVNQLSAIEKIGANDAKISSNS